MKKKDKWITCKHVRCSLCIIDVEEFIRKYKKYKKNLTIK